MNKDIHNFLVTLLHEAGHDNLDQDLEDTMVGDLSARLERRLLLTVIENLPREKHAELERMTKAKASSADITDYLKKNIKDYDRLFAQTLENFRETYLKAQLK